MIMIDVKGLTKKFGQLTAVDSLTFQLDRGEVFGLLGPNGAGKTTTIRMLCCLISRTGGSARVGDYDIGNRDDAMKIRKMIGLVPDNVGLYEVMSAYRNLEYFGRLYEKDENTIRKNIDLYLRTLGLWENRDQPVATFSKGMKQKVALARALIHEPEVLIMDEPTANLDPEAARTIRDIILDLKKEGRTILLNTHNLYEAQRICTRIGILKTRLIAVDTPQNLEKAVSEKKTVIVLEEVNETIMEAVRKNRPRSMEAEEQRLILETEDPEKEIPVIVNSIVSAGGKIRSVTESEASLEDVYMKLVNG